MAKRLTNVQKEEIIQSFIQGKTVDSLSEIYKCTVLTITRNLKKSFGEKKFKETSEKNKLDNKSQKIKRKVSRNSNQHILNEEVVKRVKRVFWRGSRN